MKSIKNKADSKKKVKKYRYVIYIILFFIIMFFLLIIIGNQNSIMITQTQISEELSDIQIESDLVKEYKYSLTPDERDLVQRIVAAEARGEVLQGQMAVAQTILDRAKLWNMLVTEVIFAKGQYADPYQGEISDSVKLAVANVFDVEIRAFREPITHFYSGKKPYWAEKKIKRGSIGKLTFCY